MTNTTEITHDEICAIVTEVSEVDFEACAKSCGRTFAVTRQSGLSLGALRAFKALKDLGYKIVKEADHG